MGVVYESIPAGAISLLSSSEQRLPYIKGLVCLPEPLLKLAHSQQAGAYIRGTMKSHNLTLEKAGLLALIVLEVMIGQTSLAQVGGAISTKLQISHEKAQVIAQDLERELFTPVMLVLNEHLTQQKQPRLSTGGADNVLDLKNKQPSGRSPS